MGHQFVLQCEILGRAKTGIFLQASPMWKTKLLESSCNGGKEAADPSHLCLAFPFVRWEY